MSKMLSNPYYNTCPVCGGHLIDYYQTNRFLCDTCPYYLEYGDNEQEAIKRAEKELEEENNNEPIT